MKLTGLSLNWMCLWWLVACLLVTLKGRIHNEIALSMKICSHFLSIPVGWTWFIIKFHYKTGEISQFLKIIFQL